MALSHNPRIVTDGLVLCLDAANPKSYSGSGTTWYDLTANENGELFNGAFYSNNSFNFDGVDDYIDCGNPASNFTIGNEHTIIVWLKRDNSGGGSNTATFQITEEGSPFEAWELYIRKSDGAIGRYASGNGGFLYSTNYAPNNEWCMVAICGLKDASGYFATSLNGSNWNTFFTGNTTTNLNIVSTTSSNIGRWTGSAWYLKGQIANVQLYNKILTDLEIKQNYNALKGRFL